MNDVMRETRQTYDLIAPKYAESKQPYVPQLDDVEAFVQTVRTGGTIADIGCGAGEEVRLLREYGFRAWRCRRRSRSSPGQCAKAAAFIS